MVSAWVCACVGMCVGMCVYSSLLPPFFISTPAPRPFPSPVRPHSLWDTHLETLFLPTSPTTFASASPIHFVIPCVSSVPAPVSTFHGPTSRRPHKHSLTQTARKHLSSIAMRSTFTLGLAALAALSAAQEQYQIDPDTVQASTRAYWCQQQIASCPQICLQQPGVSSMNTVSNDCNPVRPPLHPRHPIPSI